MFSKKLNGKRRKMKLNILTVLHQDLIKNSVAGYVARLTGTFNKLHAQLLQEL